MNQEYLPALELNKKTTFCWLVYESILVHALTAIVLIP